mmetsp:Transcript_15063/g.35385  ORF Transcript_15063/g.35385 Transcript_15063/m.35385 type:complete len:240 (-) Transcript_15063:149-868(-)
MEFIKVSEEEAKQLANASKDEIMARVAENGLLLQHASIEHREDRDVVMAAVFDNGMAWCHAWGEVLYDIEIIDVAVRNWPKEPVTDREEVLRVIADDPNSLWQASPDLLLDEAFWSRAKVLLQDSIILRVSMLSGRARIGAWTATNIETGPDGEGLKKMDVVGTAAKMFGLLDHPGDMDACDLLFDGAPLPDGKVSDWGLPLGEVIDMQFVVSDIPQQPDSPVSDAPQVESPVESDLEE